MIKGIIFDLGGTLIHQTRDWAAIVHDGAEAMAGWYLKKKHIKLDRERLVETFKDEWAAARRISDESQTEVPAQETLLATLDKIEAPATARAFVEAAVRVFFEPEEESSVAYPDAVDTLKRLKAEGYRLGLFSNAPDDKLIQRLVNRNRFRPLLSPTFSSAGWGWRKPKAEPFELIARRWQLPPEQIVVIGDTLAADILGAQNAGMAAVLVTMNENPTNVAHSHIQPSATAASLGALPEIIGRL